MECREIRFIREDMQVTDLKTGTERGGDLVVNRRERKNTGKKKKQESIEEGVPFRKKLEKSKEIRGQQERNQGVNESLLGDEGRKKRGTAGTDLISTFERVSLAIKGPTKEKVEEKSYCTRTSHQKKIQKKNKEHRVWERNP